ncbi:TAXI family TRAP transporter solute-binding subunit [Chloroflexota bacterium]
MTKMTRILVSIALVLLLLSGAIFASCAPASSDQTLITFYASSVGGTTWTLSEALTGFINKYSTWLRAENLSTSGGNENLRNIGEIPENRANCIACISGNNLLIATLGDSPWTQPYHGARILAIQAKYRNFLVSYDPNIKTPQDMIGKRIAINTKGAGGNYTQTIPLFEYWGIADQVQFEYLGWSKGAQALKDGLVDVFWLWTTGGPNEFYPGTYVTDLTTKGRLTFVTHPPEDIIEAGKLSGYPQFASMCPAGGFDELLPDYPPNDIWGSSYEFTWSCDESMDPDITYEICRIVYEHIDEFGEFHAEGKNFTREEMAQFGVPESGFHEGAIKFYKEMGIKIGK